MQVSFSVKSTLFIFIHHLTLCLHPFHMTLLFIFFFWLWSLGYGHQSNTKKHKQKREKLAVEHSVALNSYYNISVHL